MKKEVLLSLLMTTPVAFPALADINVDTTPNIDKTGGWQSILNPGSGFVDITGKDNGGITCPPGVKSLTRTFTLPQGKYVLDYGTPDPNCTITVDGKENPIVRVDGVDRCGFTVTGESATVTIVAAAKNATEEWSIQKFELTLVFNQTQAATSLTNALNAVPAIENIDSANNISAKADELRKKYNDLIAKKAELGKNIADVREGKIEAYTKYKLYNVENELAKEIATFKTNVNTHNTATKAENARYDRNTANKAKYEELVADRIALANNIDELILDLTKKISEEQDKDKKAELEKTLAGVKELKTSVDDFKAVIEEAYADLDKEIGEAVTEQFAGYEEAYQEYNALAGHVDIDYAAYKKFIDDKHIDTYNAIIAAYQNAQTALSNLKGVEGYENVFGEYIVDEGAELTKIITDLQSKVKVDGKNLVLHRVAGASVKAQEAVGALKAAEDKIKAIVERCTKFVNDQNDAMEVAQNVVETVENTFNDSAKFSAPSQFDAEVKDEKDEVTDAIKALNNVINAAYGNRTEGAQLTAATYADAKKAVDAAQATFNTWKTGLASTIKAQSDYTALIDEINEVDSEGFIMKLYKSSLDNVKSSLDNLTAKNRATEAPKISTSIENIKKAAGTLLVDFGKLNCQERLKDFNNLLDSKVIVKGNTIDKNTYTALLKVGNKTCATLALEFHTQLEAIINAHTGDEMLNQTKGKITELAANENVAKVNDKIAEIRAKYVKDATDKNIVAAESALSTYKTSVAGLNGFPMFGQAAGSDSNAVANLNTIKTNYTNAGTDEAKLAAVDGLCKTMVDTTVPDLEKKVEKALANYNAYQELAKRYDALTKGEKSKFSVLKTHNNTVNSDLVAAKVNKHYTDEITELENKARTIAVNYTKAAGAADADLSVTANTNQTYEKSLGVAETKADYDRQINEIVDGITSLTAAITNNDNARKELLGKYEATRQNLNSVIEGLDKGNSTPDGTFNPWNEEYNTYSKELDQVSKDITAAYESGTALQSKEEIELELSNIDVKINAILDNYTDAYAKAVREQNEALLEIWGWNDASKALDDAYNTAVEVSVIYQTYKNPGWKTYLNEYYPKTNGGLSSELSDITKYINAIRILKQDVENYKNNQGNLAEPKLIDQSKLELFNDKAEGYASEINAVKARVEGRVNSLADTYYSNTKKDAEDDIAANNIALSQAVYPPVNDKNEKPFTVKSDTRDAMQSALDAAVKTYDETENVGMDIDAIADYLDKVDKYDVDQVQAIAMDFFNAYYKWRNEDIQKWSKLMPTYTNDPDFNDVLDDDGTVITLGNQTKFKNGVSMMASVKAKYNAVKTDLNLKLTEAIAALDSNADAYGYSKAAYDAAKAAHNLDVTTAAEYKAYLETIDGLQTEFDKLIDFTLGLASYNTNLKDSQTALNNIKTNVDEFKKGGYSETEKATLKAAIDAFVPSLPNVYRQVALDEYFALNKQYAIVSSALNEAKVKGNFSDEEFNTLAKRVSDIQTKIAGVSAMVNDAWNNAENEAAAVEAVKGLANTFRTYELELSQLENTLKGSWMETSPLATVVADLNTLFDGVSKQVADADTYLEGCHASVKAQFGTPFAAYPDQLAKIKNDWTEMGDNVIIQKDNYIQPMEAIQKAVEDKLDDIKVAQKPFDVSNAVFADLKAQHDKLKAQADALQSTLNNSKYYTENHKWNEDKVNEGTVKYQEALDEINELLADDLAKITEKNESTDNLLEEGDELTNKVDVLDKLADFKSKLAKDNFEGAVKAYGNAVDAVKAALDNTNLLPEAKEELSAKYAAEVEKASKLPKEAPSVKDPGMSLVETIDARTAEYDAIIEALKAINADAAVKTFKAGDLNQDGETDIFDVNEFAGMILDGVTYEEVAAENLVKALAADMNRDQAFRVGDLTSIINEAAGKTPAQAIALANMRIARAIATPVEGANLVSTELVNVEGGVRRYAVNITNAAAVVAGQLDLVLADGMTVVDVQLAERSAGQTLYTSSDNRRVVLANMSNAAFEGTEGAVIYVEVYGEGNFTVDNVYFADRNSVEYRFNKPDGTSGIEDTVIDNNGSLKQRIYNAAGQALRGLQRGVNIIRNSDGSVTKEYHK